jgi:REP element-mobilizing transposase RayT
MGTRSTSSIVGGEWYCYHYYDYTSTLSRSRSCLSGERHLFPHLEKKAHEFQTIIYALNGVEDHIHLVVSIPPRYAVAEVVKNLKGASSHFLNHCGLPIEFSWQRGYGVFSLGEHQRPAAEAYVRAQKEHHRQGTTNRWLERIEEAEDGPAAPELSIMREPLAVYQTFGTEEWPF